MKIICYYNKNLKMSEGKLASQIGHVCKELGRHKYSKPEEDIIVVLGLRENKFYTAYSSHINGPFTYAQKDLGYTEVEEGTITAFGYIE